MNWQDFKEYLEEVILQKKEENEEEEESENKEENKDNKEENDSDEESLYTLRPSAKTKYSITNQKELITVLTNLITSIENNEETGYHSLPELDELLTEDGKLKAWTDYFPDRTNTHFGKKQEIEVEISAEVWKTLSQIFNSWTHEATRKKRLESAISEDQIMGKFLLEAAISLNYDLIKRKGYDIQMKDWLKEYNQLAKNEQEELIKQKEVVTKLLTAYEEESKNRKEINEESSWYQNIPWSKVLWYGGGTLLFLLVIGYLWKKFKE